MKGFLEELRWRGLLQDRTPGLDERLERGPIAAYVGFDPTAKSLQVGNLVPIMLLAHLQRAGGRPIVVLGGGTGLIGDPSGKQRERPLLDPEVVAENTERQRRQFERFLTFAPSDGGGLMVDNAAWLAPLRLVDFLRDVGKHFTLAYMLQKEAVKTRLEAGISYAEFSYMLLQAYDFFQLHERYGCEMQMGGSDQWGNITAGIELIRRTSGAEAHGVAAPLITTSSGQKFGKSEGHAVWLDTELTSPYEFHQFWINQDDRDVESYLKMFTFMSREEIAALMRQHEADPGARIPHRALARDLTLRVHGAEAATGAEAEAQRRFGKLDPRTASAADLAQLASQLPSVPLPEGFGPATAVVDLLTSSGLAKSKSEARRLIQQGGITLNGAPVTAIDASAGPSLHGYYWLTRGKKRDCLLIPRST